ncbi:Immunoglobulin subtype,Immunoglobulin-like domain,Immunoglobulin-like fold [Cinara cedri]|uniref:Immunoglobulin subtype,Immunoglobulin-like domain,Immunoglobulin-like fold n=1 Tax=Cinara cedri TaxID=506608 RepID=A0A5E4N156_9HEMI|nr:Immunoglobulin subtype,Immunoglobulin-like domain,Immunoglobulin-like fold [Cinara cedri]
MDSSLTRLCCVLCLALFAEGNHDLFELSALVPRYAKLGETVVMKCNYTIPENQLYKVQWTKSGIKLFQYIRGRRTPFIYHNVPGAKIDWDLSSASKLALMEVQHDASGQYACQVTLESPIYSKTSEYRDLTVIQIQEIDPNITTSKQVFNVGDILDATCTSGPSKPVPEITWLVNGRKPPDTYMKPIVKPAVDSASAMRLTLPISDKLGAEVQLTCLSTIPGFISDQVGFLAYADYRSSAVIVSVAAKSEPVTAGCGKEFISIAAVVFTAIAAAFPT